jgi:hypothetical protein
MPSRLDYTCDDYREEMRLLGLKKRLGEENLDLKEREMIEVEIAELEKALQLD